MLSRQLSDTPDPSSPSQAGPSRSKRTNGSHSYTATQDQCRTGPSQRSAMRSRPSQWTNGAQDIFFHTDIQEKKAMGKNYRDLQAKVDDMKANAANMTFADLKRQMEEQESLFDTVRDTSIAGLDANISLAAADAAVHLARKLKLEGNTFDVDEFFIRLRGLLGLERQQLEDMDGSDNEEDELQESLERPGPSRRARARRGQLGDWAKIGWMAARLSRRVPGAEFMYGPLKVEHRKRAAAQRRGRRDLAPEQRPQDVQPQQTQQKRDDTVSGVFEIGKLLKKLDKGDGLNFFEFAINPDDFGQSVENVFYLSFLIKDGHAGLQVSEDGEMRIYARTPPEADDEMVENDTDMLRNQTVVEFDMETWKMAIEVFDIRRPMIPHRRYEVSTGPTQGSWY